MLTRRAESGELCLDAAGFVSLQAWRNACARTDVDALDGYVGNAYGLTREHLKIAFDNGKKFSPNREGNSHEAFTWSSGPVREIDQARSIMDGWGLDWRNVPCIDSAVDWNPLSSEIARCDQWWHDYVDYALSVGFWGGYYGATAYGNRLVAFDWWPAQFPTWTWGGTGVISGTAMKQFAGYPSGNDYSSIGVTVDESQVRGGLVMATSFDSVAPSTPVVPEEVMLLTNSEVYPQFAQAQAAGYAPPDGGWPVGWLWWELTDTGKKWVHGADFDARYAWAQANNVQGLKQTTGQLQGIPDYVPPTGAVVDMGPLLAAVNGLQGSVTSVAAAVAEIPKSGTWGK